MRERKTEESKAQVHYFLYIIIYTKFAQWSTLHMGQYIIVEKMNLCYHFYVFSSHLYFFKTHIDFYIIVIIVHCFT